MPNYDVVVIGGGIAGLSAAYLLCSRGAQVAVLEANTWIGGRIGLTESHITTGAEFIHGSGGDIWKLIRRFGLATYDYSEDPTSSRYSCDGHSDAEELKHEVKRLVNQVYSGLGDQRYVSEFFETVTTPLEKARTLALEKICRVEGCDPRYCSVHDLAVQQCRRDGDGKNYRLQGGYKKLVAELIEAPFSLFAGLPVTSIHDCGDSVTIGTRSGLSFNCGAAVVTVPAKVLKEGGIDFSPPMSRSRQRAFEKIRLGNAFKILSQVPCDSLSAWKYTYSDQPVNSFWKNTESSRHYLIGFVGGDPYTDRIELIRGGVPSAFRDCALRTERKVTDLKEIKYVSWRQVPWIGFSYSYLDKGGSEALLEVGAPLTKRIVFAGEATARKGDIGTVSGAISSAFRAVEELHL